MTLPAIFLSYSRRETPFVDQLSDRLEDAGAPLWLDYKSLVPAQPWAVQIDNGILQADVFLLVVSQEALASPYVELEWKRAIELGKRVILVIYQAIPLPAALQNCEWVDLRVNFEKGLKQLLQLVQNPPSPAAPPPQSGVRAAWQVWAAIGLSALLIPTALFNAWTLLIPYLLLPLPWQIYRRRFNFVWVRFALLVLPMFTFVSGAIISIPNLPGLETVFVLLFLTALSLNFLLLALLHSKTLARWVRPEATRVQFANPLDPQIQNPRPVKFTIEHAVEDGRCAEALSEALVKAGHHPAAEGEPAEASFTLISTFQKTTRFNPEEQVVYPVLLQGVSDIAPQLARIQWIDFRGGLRNLDKLAQLLPDPPRLLKALAVAPSGSQVVYPRVISILLNYALVSGALTGGSILVILFSLLGQIFNQGIRGDTLLAATGILFNGVVLGLIILWAARALAARRGGAAALYPLLIMYIFQSLNVLLIAGHPGVQRETAFSGVVAQVLNLLFFWGGGVVALFAGLLRWKDVWRWLPRRPAGGLHSLERVLLLYTPPGAAHLLLHILFHAFLLVAFLVFALILMGASDLFSLANFLLCFLGIAGMVNLLAQFLERRRNLP